MKQPKTIVKDMITKDRDLPRYRLISGKKISSCCGAKITNGLCSNCNEEIY